MKTILVMLTVFVVLLAILVPADAKNQRAHEAERVEFHRQSAEYEAKVARGIPFVRAPKYPTKEEVDQYWSSRGSSEVAKK